MDFVDIDTVKDTPIYLDPRAIRLLQSPWGDECVSLLQSYFKTLITAIQEQRDADAKKLLYVLHEPNETHLGVSKAKAQGKALGRELADDVWGSLSTSEAIKSGLLEDLEDTILMIEGIGPDMISDTTTNIIRGPLIAYTQETCERYGIPREEVSSGPLWDPEKQTWHVEFVNLPVINHKKILLVPKVIIRRKLEFNGDEYYRHYLLEFLKGIEFAANSELVQLLKNGTSRVTKKSLIKKYGMGKDVITELTKKYPEVMDKYRKSKDQAPRKPLTHEEIAEAEGTLTPNWGQLLNDVIIVKSGNTESPKYEKAVEALLTALFYPNLSNPHVQVKIHDGRKRIDITYVNLLTGGFFAWLGRNYPAPHVFVECKNYGDEVGNPELDQLSGRFSPSRGTFGILVCRKFKEKELFLKRCKDTANDDRGFIIPLDDEDLSQLTQFKISNGQGEFAFLKSIFDNLIM